MNRKDMITLVVPVFNMKAYLTRSVDSLLKQTYQNYEIILVDDGSDDGSEELCDQIADDHPDKVRVLHQSNGGLSSARNSGIENAMGEYIIFPDPDDWVEPDYLSVLMSLRDSLRCDLEICGYYVAEGERKHSSDASGAERLNRSEALRRLMLQTGYCGFAWNKLYHLDIIRRYSLAFDTSLGMAQDLHFAFRYIMRCDSVSYNPKPVYYYFQHIGGVTNINAPLSDRKISGLKTYEKIAELAAQDYPALAAAAHATLTNMSMYFMYIYYRTDTKRPEILLMLNHNVHRYMKCFLRNKEYGLIHKAQGVTAYFSPKLYYVIRKIRLQVTK